MTFTEVIVIGGGISGMATAARLRARGIATLVLEAHGQVGGCAGFFRKRGFSFDVGATTLVDFERGGVGGQFLEEIGLSRIEGEVLSAYQVWLPDRKVTLYRDPFQWQKERLAALGNTSAHRRFWRLIDVLAETFWTASRKGIKLPIHSLNDLLRAVRLIPAKEWRLARYLRWTVSDALRARGLTHDRALRGFLAMLLQDTIHASPERAPLINGALGMTIRGAGLTRAQGGARGFWRMLVARYQALGGHLRVGTRVEHMTRSGQDFIAHTRRGNFRARQIISTLPIWNSAQLGLPEVAQALEPYLRRDTSALGGAVVVFLGVPEAEVSDQTYTHHQVLFDYDQPLKDGNNMFISVSAPGNIESAPSGRRAVMISTHCDLEDWEAISAGEYEAHKKAIGQRLIGYARKVYPRLGERAEVFEVGTPHTYAKYTHRYRGAVGGIRLNLHNSNQRAVPQDIGVPGFWQIGDTTWPGLGTVACVLGSRHVADAVCRFRG